ncbi:MAG: acyl-CoA thioesterase [Candidatus Poriferisodalaceae bacterium]
MPSTFTTDTHLDATGEGRYSGSFNRNWFVMAGPNGGLIAALLLKAATIECAPELGVRTMTVHYLNVPAEGDVELIVDIDKAGRSVTFARVAMRQGDRQIATALVLLAASRQVPFEWQQREMPSSLAVGDSLVVDDDEPPLPIRQRWEQRWATGIPGYAATNPDGKFRAGGWIRLNEPTPYDAPVLAAMTDAWVPAVMVHHDRGLHTPTLELTIHFRTDPHKLELMDDEFCLAVFTQETGMDGYLDESGEIWSADGRLLVMCRQLGLVVGMPERGDRPAFSFAPVAD